VLKKNSCKATHVKQAQGKKVISVLFKSLADDGKVYIDATPQERGQLADFLRKSIDTRQIETSNYAAVDLDNLERLRGEILRQQDIDAPLVLGKFDFSDLAKVAFAWRGYAFDQVGPDATLDVSKPFVDNLCEMGDAYLAA
jgi:hypothetical protein